MGFGTPGKVLLVNLTDSTINIEDIDEDLYHLYPGGKNLATYYLLRKCPRNADPLGPENVLVVAAGLLCGAPIPTATRFSVVARSPLTNGYGESEAGGFWGPELKFAGFEAVVVEGSAPKPVYLWIEDGKVEIRDASHLWGREPEEVQQTIRTVHADPLIRVLQIGLGGEQKVRFAAITNELRHFNGRTGMGAVMGSKNLKAIAVRGHNRYSSYAFDGNALQTLGKKLSQEAKENPVSWSMNEKGTLYLVDSLSAAGILPTHNFSQGFFEGAGKINWESYAREIFTGNHSCYACNIRCKRGVEVRDRYQVSPRYGGPEYETVAGFGSNCCVDDLQAVAKANELCNRYTLDTISTSTTIAFAMECFENGLIGLADTGGIDLRFGNAEAMLQMVERIAHRQGIGDLLAEGSRRAAQVIGKGADQFSIQVKGNELAMHDPRGKVAVALGYAISEIGGDHLVTIHDGSLSKSDSFSFKSGQLIYENLVPLSPRDLSDQKVLQYLVFENWISFGKTGGLCFFGPAPRSFILAPDVVAAVRAASGWDIGIEELLQMGERGTNMARLFNLRSGLTPADDRLPERLYMPLENGILQGVSIPRDEFQHAMTTLYALKGWDSSTGYPSPDKLQELNLAWVAGLS